MGALSPVLYAALASTTCVLGQRFHVFSLTSPKDRADIEPQNEYHQTQSFQFSFALLFGF